MSPNPLPAFSEIARFAPPGESPAGGATALEGLGALRQDGLQRAVAMGFPTTRLEEWRYTSLEPLARLPFQLHATVAGALPSRDEIARFFLGGDQARRLVFVDGVYTSALSNPGVAQAGLQLGSLSQASGKLADHLDRCVGAHENAMGALNTAFFKDGAVIRLAKGTRVEEPIHLLFITTRAEPGLVNHVRNLILAEPQSRACVFESYVSLADGQYVTNALTELAVGAGAHIEHGRLQDESLEAFHFGAVHARQERDSRYESHAFSLGGRIARLDLRTRFGEAGGYALLNGLYLVRGEQVTDHHTVVDHAQPHCESHEYYHGILDGRSKGVFNGKIFVRADAQKTDAKQTNRNLLLSGDAAIDTKPQLEIFADDVKCTHGATVGQLDEDSLFYLQARGIGREEARRMLVHAFANAVIQRVTTEALRPGLSRVVLAKLGAAKGDYE